MLVKRYFDENVGRFLLFLKCVRAYRCGCLAGRCPRPLEERGTSSLVPAAWCPHGAAAHRHGGGHGCCRVQAAAADDSDERTMLGCGRTLCDCTGVRRQPARSSAQSQSPLLFQHEPSVRA
eukprot:COSAG01_NODE_42167_length_442_cov_10.104956_1_plen_120_part_01